MVTSPPYPAPRSNANVGYASLAGNSLKGSGFCSAYKSWAPNPIVLSSGPESHIQTGPVDG